MWYFINNDSDKQAMHQIDEVLNTQKTSYLYISQLSYGCLLQAFWRKLKKL